MSNFSLVSEGGDLAEQNYHRSHITSAEETEGKSIRLGIWV